MTLVHGVSVKRLVSISPMPLLPCRCRIATTYIVLQQGSFQNVENSIFISGESDARRGCGALTKHSEENRTAYSSRLPSTRMRCKQKYAPSRSHEIASTRRSKPRATHQQVGTLQRPHLEPLEVLFFAFWLMTACPLIILSLPRYKAWGLLSSPLQ